ncbi:MAG: hypothetical protein HKN27_16320 [Silicimonas sp.]|nr:hypothetical protein [Silicimonas sp.]
MPKHSIQNKGLADDIADLVKSAGKGVAYGLGRMLAIGAAAALLGGVGGGVAAMIYGLPIAAFALGGAIVTVVAVFAIFLLVMANY